MVLDLFTALLVRGLGDASAGPAARRGDTLLVRVHAYVDRHLADVDLTPASVAAAHHVSLRYLQRLFEEQGAGVATWIRNRRLDRCRRDLADPRLAERPVRAVAARWGFTRPSDFSRAFRREYGLSPLEFRRLNAEGR
ncbi:helix-turn-helix domain-containing protein [Streptomyces sp. NPDC044984]|uniref:helix-turn-helix domain-containing protein n=1 Tax=Streptomyces sp. NPDC044984 TaxID=3154335 RepID=UPI0033D8141D